MCVCVCVCVCVGVGVCAFVCVGAFGVDSEIALEAYWVSRGESSSEELHSQSQDTDKKQSRAAMNPPSVQPLCLSLTGLSSRSLCSLWESCWDDEGEEGGEGGRSPAGSQSLISRI